MAKYLFPEGFLWGSATSAFQVEGGCVNHDFYQWSVKGRIKDNTNPCDAVLHYEKYKEDIKLLKEMNHNAARIGIEWARIEPSEGVYDENTLLHYRDELQYMKDSGIRTMVTLHHFANPLWFTAKGGWEGWDCVKYYLSYVRKAVEYLGDLIDFYITINEPTVLAYQGYFEGSFPPGKRNFLLMKKVNSILADAHIAAYSLIHEIHENKGWDKARVGVAKHMRTFDPLDPDSKLDRMSTSFINKTINYEFLDKVMNPKKNMNTLDFFGINYYTGNLIKFPLETLGRSELPKNVLGWDIYPEGFYRMLKEVWDKYHLPVYVCENGICDNDDELRKDFIASHITAMHKALMEGADIRGYFHWSSLDNFELVEGIAIRFGLIHVDHQSPDRNRTIKSSAKFYADIIKNNGIIE